MAQKRRKKSAPVSYELVELKSFLPPKSGTNGQAVLHQPYLVSFIHEDRVLAGASHKYTACSDKKWRAPGVKANA